MICRPSNNVRDAASKSSWTKILVRIFLEPVYSRILSRTHPRFCISSRAFTLYFGDRNLFILICIWCFTFYYDLTHLFPVCSLSERSTNMHFKNPDKPVHGRSCLHGRVRWSGSHVFLWIRSLQFIQKPIHELLFKSCHTFPGHNSPRDLSHRSLYSITKKLSCNTSVSSLFIIQQNHAFQSLTFFVARSSWILVMTKFLVINLLLDHHFWYILGQ